MNKTESYMLLFADSLFGNLAINPSSEFVVHSMKAFGTYNIFNIFIIVTISSVISVSINYLFGKIIKKVLSISHIEINDNSKQKVIRGVFLKYNVILLALSVIPLCGKFIQVTAGFFDIKYLRVAIICVFFKIIYYSIILLFL